MPFFKPFALGVLIVFLIPISYFLWELYNYINFDAPNRLIHLNSSLNSHFHVINECSYNEFYTRQYEQNLKMKREDRARLLALYEFLKNKNAISDDTSILLSDKPDSQKGTMTIYDKSIYDQCKKTIQKCNSLGDGLDQKRALQTLFNLDISPLPEIKALIAAVHVILHHAQQETEVNLEERLDDVLLLFKVERLLASEELFYCICLASQIFVLKTKQLLEIRRTCNSSLIRKRTEGIYNKSLRSLILASSHAFNKEIVLLHYAHLHAAKLHMLPLVRPEYTYSPSKPLPKVHIQFSSFDDLAPRNISFFSNSLKMV